MKPEIVELLEFDISSDQTGYEIEATKITFVNRGSVHVFVGLINIAPGGSYQINYEHPNIIKTRFKIMFDTAATPADAATRGYYNLVNGNKLIIQFMRPRPQ